MKPKALSNNIHFSVLIIAASVAVAFAHLRAFGDGETSPISPEQAASNQFLIEQLEAHFDSVIGTRGNVQNTRSGIELSLQFISPEEPAADPNTFDPKSDRSALMLAVISGDYTVVEMLLRAGARPDAQDSRGCTALSMAVRANDKYRDSPRSLIQPLLNHGADINKPDHDGNTPLMIAAKDPSIGADLVKFLVDNKADPTQRGLKGQNAGILAYQTITRSEIRPMQGEEAETDIQWQKKILQPQLEKIKLLVDPFRETIIDGFLSKLVQRQIYTQEAVDQLLGRRDAPAGDLGATPDHLRLILELGSGEGQRVLARALDLGLVDLAEELLNEDRIFVKDPEGISKTRSIKFSHSLYMLRPRIVDAMLRAGMDINARDLYGDTLLTRAISQHYISLAERLLELGADPNAPQVQMFSSSTPIHMAIEARSSKAVELLLKHKADPALSGRAGVTCYELALLELRMAEHYLYRLRQSMRFERWNDTEAEFIELTEIAKTLSKASGHGDAPPLPKLPERNGFPEY